MDLTVRLNQFASLFRDIGDEDYISARANYQLRLREQFFWAGLQALEKYLKAILLHNGRSTLNYSHNLQPQSSGIVEDRAPDQLPKVSDTCRRRTVSDAAA
jgi:hypothetical protein